jgi:hypothetical protein
MFGFKKRKLPMYRYEAVKVFTRHCRQEADKLLAAIIPPLHGFCDGEDGRPTLESVMSRPLLSLHEGQFKIASGERPLIASHCYAITTAIGLDTLRRNIGPSAVIEWMVYKSIIEEDVGPDNIGNPPSSWIEPPPGSDAPRIHLSYEPGTFVNGVPSLQKKLVDRYRRISAPQRLAVLLIALKISDARPGASKVLYQKPSGLDGVDEWGNYLRFFDIADALSGFPTEVLTPLISAMRAVDPFWPTFSKSHDVP